MKLRSPVILNGISSYFMDGKFYVHLVGDFSTYECSLPPDMGFDNWILLKKKCKHGCTYLSWLPDKLLHEGMEERLSREVSLYFKYLFGIF